MAALLRRRSSRHEEVLKPEPPAPSSSPAAASASGERFTLLRPRKRRTPRAPCTVNDGAAGSVSGGSGGPLKRWLWRVLCWRSRRLERAERGRGDEMASFAGGGATVRLRHLVDSGLRLVRDRTVVKLFLVLLIVYQLRLMVAAAGETAGTVAGAYDAHGERSFAPVSFVVDLLGAYIPKNGPLGGVIAVLGRHKRGLDGAVRAALPGAFGAIADFFLSWIRGSAK